jgi:stage II sporulation protein M
MSYKWWICIAIFLFGIGLAVGVVAPTSIILSLVSEDIVALEELSGVLASLPLPLVAIIIYIKNASSLVISFIFSPILCLTPALALTLNGWLIGFISTGVLQERSLSFLLAGLLPHGVFELPALIIGQASALSFGAMAVLALVKKGKRDRLLPTLKQSLKYFVLALVLLVIAAIIETYVTPLLLT